MASVTQNPAHPPVDIEPARIYGSEGPVRLRIATGGAGQTGVLEALANAFIKYCSEGRVHSSTKPFRIAWLATDTSLSFNALATRSADISITYHPYAEKIALSQGVAVERRYLWLDAFCLVGPISNPANLPDNGSLSIFELFARIFQATSETASSSSPVRFLSRYDKSANNILESRLWTSIGQTPWSHPYSPWYHRYVALPAEALRTASALGEYTLVDRGTWLIMQDTAEIKARLKCYKEGSILELPNQEEVEASTGHVLTGDSLGNPAHALLNPHAQDPDSARCFLDWMIWRDGGQRVILDFRVRGRQLHGNVPKQLDKMPKKLSCKL